MRKALLFIFALSNLIIRSQTLTISIVPPDSANHSYVYCAGTSYTFKANPSYYHNYSWGTYPSASMTQYYNPSITITFPAAGTYTIYLSCSNNLSGTLHGNTRMVITVDSASHCANGIQQITDNIGQTIIYPNPTNGTFTIKSNTSDKLTVDLYDVNGRNVLSRILFGTADIDANSLDNGVYTLTIKDSSGIAYKKLVIAH